MAKKKTTSIVGRIEKVAGDFADAVSVAATGSQIGVLELAAEDEMGVRRVRPARKKKKAAKRKAPVKKKPTVKKKAAAKKKAAPKRAAKASKAKKAKRR